MGIGDWAQSPIRNAQFPIPNPPKLTNFKKKFKQKTLNCYNFFILFKFHFKIMWCDIDFDEETYEIKSEKDIEMNIK